MTYIYKYTYQLEGQIYTRIKKSKLERSAMLYLLKEKHKYHNFNLVSTTVDADDYLGIK